MGKTRKSTENKLSKESWSIVKASRKGALDDICSKMYTAMIENNARLPYAYISKLLIDLKKSPTFDWLTRNKINKAFLKFKREMVEKEEKNSVKNTCIGMDIEANSSGDTALLSDLSGDVPSMMTKSSESIISKRSKGGRPVGTTMKAKEERKINTFKAKNEIAKRFSAVKRNNKIGKVRNGTLKQIIKQVKNEFNVNNAEISPSAIRQRFYRKREVCHHVAGHISPLERIESSVIAIVIHMARIRQSLCPSEGLRLVNSLIKDTDIQNELVAWKQKYSNNNSPTVGLGYWSRFMKRNKDKIVSKKEVNDMN